MNHCPKCGTKLEEDAKFCASCGFPVATPDIQQADLDLASDTPATAGSADDVDLTSSSAKEDVPSDPAASSVPAEETSSSDSASDSVSSHSEPASTLPQGDGLGDSPTPPFSTGSDAITDPPAPSVAGSAPYGDISATDMSAAVVPQEKSHTKVVLAVVIPVAVVLLGVIGFFLWQNISTPGYVHTAQQLMDGQKSALESYGMELKSADYLATYLIDGGSDDADIRVVIFRTNPESGSRNAVGVGISSTDELVNVIPLSLSPSDIDDIRQGKSNPITEGTTLYHSR